MKEKWQLIYFNMIRDVNITLVFLTIFVLISCVKREKFNNEVVSKPTKNESINQLGLKRNEYLDSLVNSTGFVATSIEFAINDTKCHQWNFPKSIDSIYKVNSLLTELHHSMESHDSFNWFDCKVYGIGKYNGQPIKYYLNAGGTMTFVGASKNWYFGCESDDCAQYFITTRLPDNYMEEEPNGAR